MAILCPSDRVNGLIKINAYQFYQLRAQNTRAERPTLRTSCAKRSGLRLSKALGDVLRKLCGCSGSSSDWTAFVYPDIENIPGPEQAQNYAIGNYSSFEECQVAAIDRLRSNNAQSGKSGDYMCGYKNAATEKTLGGCWYAKKSAIDPPPNNSFKADAPRAASTPS